MCRINRAAIIQLLLLLCLGWQTVAWAGATIKSPKVNPGIRQALLKGTAQEVIVEFDDARLQSDASTLRHKAGQQFENAAVLDITALQLLYAAERDAARSGVRITLEGSVPEAISAAMTDAGCAKFQFQQ